MAQQALTAEYASTSGTHTFSSDLPPLPKEDNVEEKTTYLSALRASASKVQGEINAFLTQKMEEDKAADAVATGVKKVKIDEDKEEEMYGEEDPEKDG